MKKDLLVFVVILSALLASCGPVTPIITSEAADTSTPASAVASSQTPAVEISPAITSSPDPCSTKEIEAEVQKVHSHMREFDDASLLASNLPRDQLKDSISDLQKIRREAEDEEIPGCLANLKKYEVDHMNTVINTLVAFMGGTSKETLEQGISLARDQHDQYTIELARLLGLTVVPATPPALNLPTETATPK
jgi:hypothetical protein